MVFPQVYDRYEPDFKSGFLMVKGRLSRRDGAHNIVVSQVKSFAALEKTLSSRDWR
jgi:error-prone DNA polymerase